MNPNLTEIVFILDCSGSMAGLEADTIGGFNAMIAKQQKEPGEALISTVLFNHMRTGRRYSGSFRWTAEPIASAAPRHCMMRSAAPSAISAPSTDMPAKKMSLHERCL